MARRPLLYGLRITTSRWLGSWKLSVVLMVALSLYYAFLLAWSASSPSEVVRRISSLLPFLACYVLLLLNTAICFWRRFPLLRRQISTAPMSKGLTPAWVVDDSDRRDGAQVLKKKGFRPGAIEESGEIWGIRGRWAALGSYLFHGAFFLVATGFLLTSLSRREVKAWVAEGEPFPIEEGQILQISPPRFLSPIPPRPSFEVKEIRTTMWRDQFLFTDLEADLSLPGDDQLATTRINRPLWLGPGTFLRLSGVGWTPRFELTDSSGQVLDSAFAKLQVFPPGQEDTFFAQGFPHRFTLKVWPDAEIVDGELVNRSLNLVSPLAEVRISRGRLELARGILALGETLEFEGIRLRIPEIRYWGEFSIVRDLGAPVIFLGFAIGMLGLLLKLTGPRRETRWIPTETGGRLEGWGAMPDQDPGDPAVRSVA